jgi:hypothetical protein
MSNIVSPSINTALQPGPSRTGGNPGGSQPDNVVFFFNFFDELRRIAPKQ